MFPVFRRNLTSQLSSPHGDLPGIVKECVNVGIRGAIIISAGFKEIGASGAALEQQVLAEARRGNMRIVGPYCLGVMSPRAKFNATFAAGWCGREVWL